MGGFVVVFLLSLASVLSKCVLRSANMTQMQQLFGRWADLLYILVRTDVFSSWWRSSLMDTAVLRTIQSTAVIVFTLFSFYGASHFIGEGSRCTFCSACFGLFLD